MRKHAVESSWRSLYNRMLTHGGSEGLHRNRAELFRAVRAQVSRALVLIALAIHPAGAQEPLVRVNTRLVEIDISVRNKSGPVAGLSAADFSVFDNGKPQKIAVFAVNSRKPATQSSPL